MVMREQSQNSHVGWWHMGDQRGKVDVKYDVNAQWEEETGDPWVGK